MKYTTRNTFTSPLAISLLFATLIMLGSFGFLAQYISAQGYEPTYDACCSNWQWGGSADAGWSCAGDMTYVLPGTCPYPGPGAAAVVNGVCGTPLAACEDPYLNCVSTGPSTTECDWVYPTCAQPTATTGRYSCTTGTSINNIQNDSTWQWTWTCQGSGGGTNASCSEARPNQAPFVFAGVDITLRQPATSVTVGDAQAFDR